MAYLLLSGGAYGVNWLPLITPLVAILILLYAGDLAAKYYRRWRLHRENKLVRDLGNLPESESDTGI